jgi:lincosamide nucleotidyltransferase A/C/D/E
LTSDDVLRLYTGCRTQGVRVWIDGGWCVDALLGKQTREHSDLDLAVGREDVDELRSYLASLGFVPVAREGSTDWNFVLACGALSLDVHVFAYDESGQHIYGIAYPWGSLTGTGTLDGQPVECVAPQWMFSFKTAYSPAEKDLWDVRALAERFGFSLPEGFRGD